jgi:DNA modification methylase
MMPSLQIALGDCRETLRTLAAGSVHCCVTSPPYWGLRDYRIKGQIGLEKTPELYVAELVKVFREVWRVLRDDVTLRLNLGDSYASTGGHADTACRDRRGSYNIGNRPEYVA